MMPKKSVCRDPVLFLAQEKAEREKVLRDFTMNVKRSGKEELGLHAGSATDGGDADSRKIALAASQASHDGDSGATRNGKRGRLGGAISRGMVFSTCHGAELDVPKTSKHRIVPQGLASDRDVLLDVPVVLPEASVPISHSLGTDLHLRDVIEEERSASEQCCKDSEGTDSAKQGKACENSPDRKNGYDILTSASGPSPSKGGTSSTCYKAEVRTEIHCGGRGFRDTFSVLRDGLQQLAAESTGMGLDDLKKLGNNAVPMFLSKLHPTSVQNPKATFDSKSSSLDARRKVSKVAKTTNGFEPSHTSFDKRQTRFATPISILSLKESNEAFTAHKGAFQLPGQAGVLPELVSPVFSRTRQDSNVNLFWESDSGGIHGVMDYHEGHDCTGTVDGDYREICLSSSKFGAVEGVFDEDKLSHQSPSPDQPRAAECLPRVELRSPCSGHPRSLLWDLNLQPPEARNFPTPSGAFDGFISTVTVSPQDRLQLYESPKSIVPFPMIPFGRQTIPYGGDGQHLLEVHDSSGDDHPGSPMQLEDELVDVAWREVLSPAVDSPQGFETRRSGSAQGRRQAGSILSPPQERNVNSQLFEDFGRYNDFL